jgi:hypothetical protein
MTKSLSLLAAALTLMALAVPAEAAGVRRVWRGQAPIGGISRDVITPWYVGYHGSHYSYYRPDPVPRRRSVSCWQWIGGQSAWIC